jgi:hypothetical protein
VPIKVDGRIIEEVLERQGGVCHRCPEPLEADYLDPEQNFWFDPARPHIEGDLLCDPCTQDLWQAIDDREEQEALGLFEDRVRIHVAEGGDFEFDRVTDLAILDLEARLGSS